MKEDKCHWEKTWRVLGWRKEAICNFNLGGRVGLLEKVTAGQTWKMGCRYPEEKRFKQREQPAKTFKVGVCPVCSGNSKEAYINYLDTKATQRNKQKTTDKIPNEYTWKNRQQHTSKPTPTAYLKDCTLWSSGDYPRNAGCEWFNMRKLVNVTHHISRRGRKTNDCLSWCRKAFDNIQHPFMIKKNTQKTKNQ